MVNLIIGISVYFLIVKRIFDKASAKWGFAGEIWSHRIFLAILYASMVLTLKDSADTFNQFMIHAVGFLLCVNMVVYNPWTLPEIIKKRKELEENEK